jgi:hypothetical protein
LEKTRVRLSLLISRQRLNRELADGFDPRVSAERSLADALWWVADGMQKCPPHTWNSPVTMKLDPEHIAWTCSRCGAIATSDDRAVRPA